MNEKKYRVREGVILKEVAGEYMLLASGKASAVCPMMKMLNESGAFIWKELAEGKSLEEIEADAAEKYETPRTEIREALTRMIESMVRYGYLK